MQEVRCPDCGFRLKTNECPICCKRVPFPAAETQKTVQTKPNRQRSFEVSFPKAGTAGKRKKTQNPKPKIVTAVVAVCMAVLPLVGDFLDEIQTATPEPGYYEEAYYSDYQEAGSAGAEHLPAMEPQTIYDDHGILISVDSFGLLYDDPAVSVTISNTSDRNVTVSTDFMAVNGYMMNSSGLFYETQAGETVQTHLRLYAEDLEAAGIDTVANVELHLDLYDSDDYSDVDPNVQIELETAAAGLVQSVDDSGLLVYDSGGVRLIFKDARVDDYGDAMLTFFTENLTDHAINIGSDMVYINGRETDGMLWNHLWRDKRSIDHVYIFDLSELGIDETGDLKEITLELYIENAENWETVYESVTIDITE